MPPTGTPLTSELPKYARRRRMHLVVKTEDFNRYADMRRYIGYRDTPVTSEPIRANWAGSSCIVHRFEEGDLTYLRQPSLLNRNWVRMAIDRYASFGVKAGSQMR